MHETTELNDSIESLFTVFIDTNCGLVIKRRIRGFLSSCIPDSINKNLNIKTVCYSLVMKAHYSHNIHLCHVIVMVYKAIQNICKTLVN